MKRQKQKSKHLKTKNQNGKAPAQASGKAPTRRDFFNKVRNGVIAAVVVGGGGWFVADEVMATVQEHDLTKLGNGVPTVVQIHDPQCPKCVALQREARKALENFEEDQLQYLVANIRSPEGRALAATHGVSHVTLLLFDAAGKNRQVLAGQNRSDYLTEAFQKHVDKYGRR